MPAYVPEPMPITLYFHSIPPLTITYYYLLNHMVSRLVGRASHIRRLLIAPLSLPLRLRIQTQQLRLIAKVIAINDNRSRFACDIKIPVNLAEQSVVSRNPTPRERCCSTHHANKQPSTKNIPNKRRNHALPDIITNSQSRGMLEDAGGDEEHVSDNVVEP